MEEKKSKKFFIIKTLFLILAAGIIILSVIFKGHINFSKKTEEMEPQIQTEQYEENIGNINTQEDLNEN